jgi:flagellar motor switch protein FliG
MMPSTFGAKVLLQLPESSRADIINRAVNMKNVSPKAAQIIETRVVELMRELDADRNSVGSIKIAEVMNELEKTQVDTLLASLESISTESVKKVRPKIFLFDDVLYMPQRSRVQLFNDVSGDIITMALRGSNMQLRESVLASIGARQRRMIESDLAAGDVGINPRDIAIARRSITQEAIRLAASGQIELKEKEAAAA